MTIYVDHNIYKYIIYNEVTPVRGSTLAKKVDEIADAIIQHVAGVTNDRVKIARLALNFKVDYKVSRTVTLKSIILK